MMLLRIFLTLHRLFPKCFIFKGSNNKKIFSAQKIIPNDSVDAKDGFYVQFWSYMNFFRLSFVIVEANWIIQRIAFTDVAISRENRSSTNQYPSQPVLQVYRYLRTCNGQKRSKTANKVSTLRWRWLHPTCQRNMMYVSDSKK